MLNTLNAVASLALLQNSRVPSNERAALTAVSAFTPGVLGLAVPFVAASAARRGRGRGFWAPRTQAGAPPAQVLVPAVVGATFDAASATLATWALLATRVDTYSDQPDGQVIAQWPAAGQSAPLNSAVTLAVSKHGPPPDPPPGGVKAELAGIETKVSQVEDRVTQLQDSVKQILARLPANPPAPDAAPAPAPAAEGVPQATAAQAPTAGPVAPQSASSTPRGGHGRTDR